jgi:hypothetical protein
MKISLNSNRRSMKVTKVMSAGQFVSLAKTDRAVIKSSKFVAPKLGGSSMGKFIVELTHGGRK